MVSSCLPLGRISDRHLLSSSGFFSIFVSAEDSTTWRVKCSTDGKWRKLLRYMFKGTFEMKKMTHVFCTDSYTPSTSPIRQLQLPYSQGHPGRNSTAVSTGNMCLHPLQGVHTPPSPCAAVLDKKKNTQHCAYHCRSALWPSLSLNLVQSSYNKLRKGLPQWF